MNPIFTISAQNHSHSAQPWQQALANAIRSPETLLAALELSTEQLPPIFNGGDKFPLRVPHSFVSRMKKGDPNDPLLRQVLPLDEENNFTRGYLSDPVGDLAASEAPGLLHKYHGRALMITTGACAIHCRYCFRRHFPYHQQNAAANEWDAALSHLNQDKSINEVILSGGDPLALSDQRLATLLEQLTQIPHLTRLRIHTRLPVVIPSRITDALIAMIANCRLTPVIVIHANHANEINNELHTALKRLQAIPNITLLNQSVLLRGINDNHEALIALSEALFASGVLPYYLHLLDKAQGTAHFDVPITQAVKLLNGIHAKLPGYLVPRLAHEEAGAQGKTLITITPSHKENENINDTI
ncbi:MAG: EF-P beta-lysylation protein EpmB [Thiotrichaceae bacterium]|nr:EF-P beta-lysylation protein EpmB [Thiotrichaceae bacterium]PCI13456.1 MAG: EF-P beta-lysylation protein EpmB [Thiotrichales bacterium]